MAEACINCGKPASFLCSRCAERYCSAKCQIMNWSTHKLSCFAIPYLVPLPEKDTDDCLYVHNGAVCVKGADKEVTENLNHAAGLKELPLHATGKENKIPVTASVPKLETSRASEDSAKSSNTIKKQDATTVVPSTTMINGWKKVHVPPMKEFFSVVVRWVEDLEPTAIWVTQLQHEEALEQLKVAMQAAVRKQSMPVNSSEVKAGALLATGRNGVFYRAKVLGIKSQAQTATLRLIDYGKLATPVPFNELYSVVPELQNENAYAFRIRIPKDVLPVTQSAVLTVRAVAAQAPEGIYTVEVKPDSLPETLPMEFLKLRTGVVLKKIFPDGKHGLIQLQLPCKNREMSAILESEQASKYILAGTPAKGDFVAAKTTSGWYRTIMLGTAEQGLHLVYLLDEGKVRLTTEIKKVPKEFIKHPARVLLISNPEGMLVSLIKYLDSEKTIPLKFSANITDTKNVKDVMCSLGESEFAVKASCFRATDDQLDIKYWVEPICDKNVVIITSVESFSEIHIAPYQTKKYEKFFAEIVKQCQQYAKEEPISKGDLVLVKCHTSGSYFRAEVLGVHKNKNDVKLINVDTGVANVSTRRNLWKANCFVRLCPVYTQKAQLSFLDAMRTPFVNNKALTLLKELQTNSTEFIVKFQSTDKSVELFYRNASNESLNKKLLPLVFEDAAAAVQTTEPVEPIKAVDAAANAQPSAADEVSSSTTTTPITSITVEETPTVAAEPKSEKTVKTKYVFDDIDVLAMTTGDDVQIYVLDSSLLLARKYVTACNYSRENMNLMKECIDKINKYCNGPDAVRGYAPEQMELCFANFADDGNWYRAVCVRIIDQKYEIMFYDFGNITKVSENDIVRMPMTQEFMFPTLANMINFSNCTAQQISEFIKKSMANPIYQCKLIKSPEDEDSYEIVF